MNQKANAKMVTKLMFRLLPIQILLAMVGAVNGIVSSFFASNYVGINAMGAVGLYNPLGMLINSISTILVGGGVILTGKYMGENRPDKVQNVFSLTLLLSIVLALVFFLIYIVLGVFDLTGFLTRDLVVRKLFNSYLLGQSIGLLPLMLGNAFASFLSLENKGRRTITASLIYIGVNLILNYMFVQLMRLEALGLALASSLGMWVFMGIQGLYFLSGRSYFRFQPRNLVWNEAVDIFRIGLPGALSFLYQTARGLIVNSLLIAYVGSVAVSAFAASDSVLRIFWAIPGGMLAVSRMLISVSIGEEDRQTLTDVMRVMFKRFIPLMCLISTGIILCAFPFTGMFFHDPSKPVFMMTIRAFHILPLCMPLSIICMHFVCYGQASGKQGLVHLLSILDGVVCVAGFTALMIPFLGINGVYIANVLNGVVTTLVIIGYAWLKKKRFPRNMEELMVIPEDFGVPAEQRLDLSIRNREGVVRISEQVHNFCLERGIDSRRAYLAGLSLEEMAGNVVDHGFTKDNKHHYIDVRVVHKDDDVILRVKDDCVPFDPHERQGFVEGDDIVKNIGIRMVFRIAGDVRYQNILGLNVLTIRI